MLYYQQSTEMLQTYGKYGSLNDHSRQDIKQY